MILDGVSWCDVGWGWVDERCVNTVNVTRVVRGAYLGVGALLDLLPGQLWGCPLPHAHVLFLLK